MIEILKHTLIDSLHLLPFLFLAFFIIELIEHKFSKKSKDIVKKSGKFGPLLGSLLGLFPQCGFSVLATNLYTTRIITLGTLIAIYLSTSDEMLPILLSSNVKITEILKILGIKFITGITFGFIIDFILRKKQKDMKPDYHLCEEEHCNCEKGLLYSTCKHTVKIFSFVFLSTFIINILIHYIGKENISNLLLGGTIFAPFISSLIGLIPNCAASVIITELYLNNIITLGTTMSGLLTGSGLAILVLFKTNNNKKENLFIISIIYVIGVLIGSFINAITLLIG